MAGFEPTTFRSQSGRATKLRHIPCVGKRTGGRDPGPTPGGVGPATPYARISPATTK